MAGRPLLFVALVVVAVGPAVALLASGVVDSVVEMLFVLLVGTVSLFVGVVSQVQGPVAR